MPIYEYECEACTHELEALQKISDPPLQECPSCHALKLRKKVSAAGFRLKGGGWYETDFKSAGKKNVAGEKETSTATDTAAKSESSGAEKSAGSSEKTSTAAPTTSSSS